MAWITPGVRSRLATVSDDRKEPVFSQDTIMWMVLPSLSVLALGFEYSEYVLTKSENPNLSIWLAVAFSVIWSTIVGAPDAVRYLRRHFPG